MSVYLSRQYAALKPYVPGEQPRDRKYLKLNTNESPFAPSPKAVQYAAEAAKGLNLYSDPTCLKMREALADHFGLDVSEVTVTNGSDEGLYFAFSAYCDSQRPAVFPDITYGFYPVFAERMQIPYREIPVKEDFSIDPEDYMSDSATVVIANPNALTGLLLPLDAIASIAEANPHQVVVIDEAYVDFGNDSAVSLIRRYPNLLITGTFSKSRSLAGGRLGFVAGDKELIQDIEMLRYSSNPYNVNSMTLAAGIGALEDEAYTKRNCEEIVKNREDLKQELKALGFTVTDSKANFVFASHPALPGGTLYEKLKEKGVLIRHFRLEKIKDYSRITIGTKEQMKELLTKIREILEETK
ncbi:MAG: histidinol-phosphate transaminase [Clostridia bacterium]|nr:histidinol-phosphate transaminase [Clostridia bacterium]